MALTHGLPACLSQLQQLLCRMWLSITQALVLKSLPLKVANLMCCGRALTDEVKVAEGKTDALSMPGLCHIGTACCLKCHASVED